MKTIEYEDVEFYQNPDKRKTVAVCSGLELDAYVDFLQDNNLLVNTGLSMDQLINIPEEIMMPSTIKAMSTCHSNDNWDPEIGKKQAYYKLLRTYNKMKNRAFKRFIELSKHHITVLDNLVSKCDNRVSHYDQLVRHPRRSSDGV